MIAVICSPKTYEPRINANEREPMKKIARIAKIAGIHGKPGQVAKIEGQKQNQESTTIFWRDC